MNEIEQPDLWALTLCQPYAECVFHQCPDEDPWAAKQLETRGWRCKLRGTLYIHAGAKHVPDYKANWLFWVKAGLVEAKKWDRLPFTAIIGVVDVVDIRPVEQELARLKAEGEKGNWRSEREILMGDYSPGRWAWELKNPRRFKTPVPCAGAMSVWRIARELHDQVKQETRNAVRIG